VGGNSQPRAKEFCVLQPDAKSIEQFWEEAIVRLLNPVQLLILEAITRLERPISATIMVQIDDRITLALYDYHLKRMVKTGLLELTDKKKRRGSYEKFYTLRVELPEGWAG
jgi:hypothetical protein